jgi:hypothetical protein
MMPLFGRRTPVEITLSEFVCGLAQSVIKSARLMNRQHIEALNDFFETPGDNSSVEGNRISRPKLWKVEVPRQQVVEGQPSAPAQIPLAALAQLQGLAIDDARLEVDFTLIDGSSDEADREMRISFANTRIGLPCKLILSLRSKEIPEGLAKLSDSLGRSIP